MSLIQVLKKHTENSCDWYWGKIRFGILTDLELFPTWQKPYLQLKYILGPDVLYGCVIPTVMFLCCRAAGVRLRHRESWGNHNGGWTWPLVPTREVTSLVLGHTKGIRLLQDSDDGSPLTPPPRAQISHLSSSISWGQILCESEIALVQWQCKGQIKPIISVSKGNQIDFYTVGLWCKKYSADVCWYFKDIGPIFYFINSCNNGRILICPSELRFPGRTGGTIHMCQNPVGFSSMPQSGR